MSKKTSISISCLHFRWIYCLVLSSTLLFKCETSCLQLPRAYQSAGLVRNCFGCFGLIRWEDAMDVWYRTIPPLSRTKHQRLRWISLLFKTKKSTLAVFIWRIHRALRCPKKQWTTSDRSVESMIVQYHTQTWNSTTKCSIVHSNLRYTFTYIPLAIRDMVQEEDVCGPAKCQKE